VLAVAIATAAPGLQPELYERFAGETADADPLVRATALVFAAACAGPRAEEFARLGIALAQADAAAVPAVAAALALLPMETDLASRLFFAGAALALFAGGVALPLVAAAARHFGPEPDLCRAVSPEAVAALSAITGLDWATEAAYAAVSVIAVFAESGEEATIAEFIASRTEEPLARVAALVVGGQLAAATEVDFGEKALAVGACTLNLLTVLPTPSLVKFAIALGERKPSVFAGVNVLGAKVGAELLKSVSNALLTTRLALASRGERRFAPLPPVLAPLVEPEAQPLRISHEQAMGLIAALFP
jgi:hypothetical protein